MPPTAERNHYAGSTKPWCNKWQLLERASLIRCGGANDDDNPSRLDTPRRCYPSARCAYGAYRWRSRSEDWSHNVRSYDTRPQTSDQAETVQIHMPRFGSDSLNGLLRPRPYVVGSLARPLLK